MSINLLPNLKDKEILELRLKCLEIFVTVSSKHGIEKEEVFLLAEKAWQFISKPIRENQGENVSTYDPSKNQTRTLPK